MEAADHGPQQAGVKHPFTRPHAGESVNDVGHLLVLPDEAGNTPLDRGGYDIGI